MRGIPGQIASGLGNIASTIASANDPLRNLQAQELAARRKAFEAQQASLLRNEERVSEDRARRQQAYDYGYGVVTRPGGFDAPTAQRVFAEMAASGVPLADAGQFVRSANALQTDGPIDSDQFSRFATAARVNFPQTAAGQQQRIDGAASSALGAARIAAGSRERIADRQIAAQNAQLEQRILAELEATTANNVALNARTERSDREALRLERSRQAGEFARELLRQSGASGDTGSGGGGKGLAGALKALGIEPPKLRSDSDIARDIGLETPSVVDRTEGLTRAQAEQFAALFDNDPVLKGLPRAAQQEYQAALEPYVTTGKLNPADAHKRFRDAGGEIQVTDNSGLFTGDTIRITEPGASLPAPEIIAQGRKYEAALAQANSRAGTTGLSAQQLLQLERDKDNQALAQYQALLGSSGVGGLLTGTVTGTPPAGSAANAPVPGAVPAAAPVVNELRDYLESLREGLPTGAVSARDYAIAYELGTTALKQQGYDTSVLDEYAP